MSAGVTHTHTQQLLSLIYFLASRPAHIWQPRSFFLLRLNDQFQSLRPQPWLWSAMPVDIDGRHCVKVPDIRGVGWFQISFTSSCSRKCRASAVFWGFRFWLQCSSLSFQSYFPVLTPCMVPKCCRLCDEILQPLKTGAIECDGLVNNSIDFWTNWFPSLLNWWPRALQVVTSPWFSTEKNWAAQLPSCSFSWDLPQIRVSFSQLRPTWFGKS